MIYIIMIKNKKSNSISCVLCASTETQVDQTREWDQLLRCKNCGIVFAWPQLEEDEFDTKLFEKNLFVKLS